MSRVCTIRNVFRSSWNFFLKPPGFYLENNAYFTIYPINRWLFPIVDPLRDIIYELYTSSNPENAEILLLNNDESINNSSIDFANPTIIYFHGFLESSSRGSSKIIHEAYTKRGDHNIILVNAQRLVAGPWYLTAASNAKVIGAYTALFIDYLVSIGLDLQKLHIIGHSLGGQIAGICGYNVKSGQVSRITALDPAKPMFVNAPPEKRIDKGDAEFVDIIHTSSGKFGLEEPLGHADFYPNGGKENQPGCSLLDVFRRNPTSILEMIFCSHWRSVLFYAESVNNPDAFVSINANTWKNFIDKDYNVESKISMGFGASPTASGNYYCDTNENSPFSRNYNIFF